VVPRREEDVARERLAGGDVREDLVEAVVVKVDEDAVIPCEVDLVVQVDEAEDGGNRATVANEAEGGAVVEGGDLVERSAERMEAEVQACDAAEAEEVAAAHSD
jgi:hypothetical protein